MSEQPHYGQHRAAPGLPARPSVRLRSLALPVLGWGLLGGVGPLLLLGLVITLYGWVTGVGASGFPLRGTGPPAPPLSELAATNALGHAFLYVFLLGLPVFAVGSIVGVSLAIARYVARKEQGRAGWPASTREAEDVRAMTEKLFGDTEEGGAVLGRLFGGVPGTAWRRISRTSSSPVQRVGT